MERGTRVVQAGEVAVGADLGGEPEAVELAPDVVVGLGHGEDDPALLQVVGQLEEGLPTGVVDVVDGVGAEHEPARRIGDVHQRHDLVGETGRVGVEDPDPEPVDDQAGLGDRARRGAGQPEPSLVVPVDDRVVGGEVACDVQDQRQEDRQDDPLLDPDGDHDDRRQQGDPELVPGEAVDGPHPLDGDQLDADQEDDRGEHRLGQVLERPGQKQQDDGDHDRGRELGDLGVAVGLVDHLGLGRATVDGEGPAEPGRDVGQAEPDEVGVLLEALVVLDRVGA